MTVTLIFGNCDCGGSLWGVHCADCPAAPPPRETPPLFSPSDEQRLKEIEMRIRRTFDVNSTGNITQTDFNFVFDCLMLVMQS